MPIIKKEEVIDSWSILIGGAQTKAEEIFEKTNELIARTKVPNVKQERKLLSTGLIQGLLVVKRDFLVISETGNPRLKPFQMLVGARDYGNNLDVCWYLTIRPSLWQKIMAFLLAIPILGLLVLPFALIGNLGRMAKEKRSGLALDLFDEQDLRAYVTNAHHCLMEAVDKLMQGLNQDTSKIDRKSRGFLGIS